MRSGVLRERSPPDEEIRVRVSVPEVRVT